MMTGYCSGCGELVEEVVCVEEIPDFCCGRPSVQKHEYLGSPCCGEEVIPESEVQYALDSKT